MANRPTRRATNERYGSTGDIATPNRPLLLAAKTTTFGAVALIAGETAAFGNFWAREAVLTAATPHASLTQPDVLRTVVVTGAFLARIGLLGLGR